VSHTHVYLHQAERGAPAHHFARPCKQAESTARVSARMNAGPCRKSQWCTLHMMPLNWSPRSHLTIACWYASRGFSAPSHRRPCQRQSAYAQGNARACFLRVTRVACSCVRFNCSVRLQRLWPVVVEQTHRSPWTFHWPPFIASCPLLPQKPILPLANFGT